MVSQQQTYQSNDDSAKLKQRWASSIICWINDYSTTYSAETLTTEQHMCNNETMTKQHTNNADSAAWKYWNNDNSATYNVKTMTTQQHTQSWNNDNPTTNIAETMTTQQQTMLKQWRLNNIQCWPSSTCVIMKQWLSSIQTMPTQQPETITTQQHTMLKLWQLIIIQCSNNDDSATNNDNSATKQC